MDTHCLKYYYSNRRSELVRICDVTHPIKRCRICAFIPMIVFRFVVKRLRQIKSSGSKHCLGHGQINFIQPKYLCIVRFFQMPRWLSPTADQIVIPLFQSASIMSPIKFRMQQLEPSEQCSFAYPLRMLNANSRKHILGEKTRHQTSSGPKHWGIRWIHVGSRDIMREQHSVRLQYLIRGLEELNIPNDTHMFEYANRSNAVKVRFSVEFTRPPIILVKILSTACLLDIELATA
mmetsp:Transcript_37769/g.62106  ORF Transcript_37769/g.62106 Transcript_37769/m.62106 type:complete len:234 (+) Transcript_37769:77-778(+)